MNDEVQKQLTRALDERARDLDGATLSRLRQARAHAMQAYPSHRQRWQPAWMGAVALAGMALVAVLLFNGTDPNDPGNWDTPDDAFEIATLDVDLEVIENLDFYEWLSEQDLNKPAGAGPA